MIKTLLALRTREDRTRGVRAELGHDGTHILAQSLAWPIRITLIKGPGADRVSRQFAWLSCTSRRRACSGAKALADLSCRLRGHGIPRPAVPGAVPTKIQQIKPTPRQCPPAASHGLARNKWSLRFTLGRFYTPAASYEPRSATASRAYSGVTWERNLFKLDVNPRPSYRREILRGSKTRLRYKTHGKSRAETFPNGSGNKVLMNNRGNRFSCVVIIKIKKLQ